jgi:hypothetical protein
MAHLTDTLVRADFILDAITIRRRVMRPRGLVAYVLPPVVTFVVMLAVTSVAATASNRHVASTCTSWASSSPPSLGAVTEIDSSPRTVNEGEAYANRDFNGKEYVFGGTLWDSESEPAGTWYDQYFDPQHANYPNAQVGVYNRTYGSATTWYLWGFYAC